MLGRLLGGEERAISYQTIWGSGGDFVPGTDSGANINPDTAFRVGAFYSCVLLIADTVATLPMDVFIRRDGARYPYRPKPAWVDKPDLERSRIEHFQQVLVSLLVDGNAFTRIYRNGAGEIVDLVAIAPSRVKVERFGPSREIGYVIDNDYANPVRKDDMLHLTELLKPNALRGVSRVEELRDSIGLSAAVQSFAARFFGQGANMAGHIESPAVMNSEQAKELVEGFSKNHSGYRKAHKVGLLTAGAKFVKTGTNPNEAQMIESRQLATEEMCRLFLVPPHMVGVTTAGTMSYASVEQNSINFVTHTLRRYIAKVEEAYSGLLGASGAFFRINVDGLLRGDFATRMNGYSIGSQAGFLSVNDIHRFEDWTPVEGGDVYRVPAANIDLAASALVETDKKVQMVQRLVSVGYDPEAALAALNLPPIAHTGVPSTQLQAVATIDPENPASVYGV